LKGICLIKIFDYGEAEEIFLEYIKETTYDGDLTILRWLEMIALPIERFIELN
jgi:hypothetical protein